MASDKKLTSKDKAESANSSDHLANSKLSEEATGAFKSSSSKSKGVHNEEKSSDTKKPDGEKSVLELKDLFSKNSHADETKSGKLTANPIESHEKELIIGDFNKLFSSAIPNEQGSKKDAGVSILTSDSILGDLKNLFSQVISIASTDSKQNNAAHSEAKNNKPVGDLSEGALSSGKIASFLGGQDLNALDPSVKAKVETIAKNYDSPTKSGKDVLRDVHANVEMINTLPGHDRAKIMGWSQLPEDQKTAMGWVKEPSENLKRALKWEQLSEQDKENIRWQGVRIQGQQVLGQMFNGELQNSSNANLLKDLRTQVEARYQESHKEVEGLKAELAALESARKLSVDNLDEKTREGVWKIWNVFNNGRNEEFSQNQTEQLKRIAELDSKIAEKTKQCGAAESQEKQIELAKQVEEYQQLVAKGKRSDADNFAVKLWQEHGSSIAMLAPGVWSDLTNSEKGKSILAQLQQNGQAHFDRVPSYAGGDCSKPELSELGLRQALGLSNADNAEKPMGLMQLRPDSQLIDGKALQMHMLGRIEADPVLNKFSTDARELNGSLNDLMTMFNAAQRGTVYENFIDNAKERANKVKELMDKTTVEDLRGLEGRIGTMSEALSQMKSESSQHSADAIKELEDRINSFKNMHNLLNRFDQNPTYPEVLKQENGESPSSPNKNMRQMVDMILDNGLQPSTITSWMSQNGIVITSSIVAAAATVAAISSYGAATPLANAAYTGLAISVSGLAAREITSECLYQYNKDGYTGWGHYGEASRAGNWTRSVLDRSAVENLKALGTDVLAPYTGELVRDWAAFMVSAGLVNHFTQVGNATMRQSFANLFKTPPANLQQLAFEAERAAAIQSGSGTGASFMRQFMGNFGRELMVNSGFTAAQISGESLVQAGLGSQLTDKLGHWGQFGLSFGISTAIALGQGYRHGRNSALLHEANMKSGNLMEFKLSKGVQEQDFIDHMRRQGFEINQTKPGQWEVRPFGAPANFQAMKMENVSARGDGSPNLESMPAGHEPKMKEGGNHLEPAITEVQQVGQSIVDGNYHQAVLRSEQSSTAQLKVISRDVPFHESLYKKDPEAYMRRYLKEMSDKGGYTPSTTGNQHQLVVPAPVLRTQNAKVNLANGEVLIDGQSASVRVNPVTGKVELPPTGKKTPIQVAAEAQFEQAKNQISKEHFQRIALEQAIIQTEERLHHRQTEKGGNEVSSLYKDFKREMNESPLDAQGNRTSASKEQEIILALHEAGWPLSMIEHHYGGQFHTSARKSALDYVRAKEALAHHPDRQLIEQTIEGASPQLRREMIERLPGLLNNPETADDVILGLNTVASSGNDLQVLENSFNAVREGSANALSNKDFLACLSKSIEGIDFTQIEVADRARQVKRFKESAIDTLNLPEAEKAILRNTLDTTLKKAQEMEVSAASQLKPEQVLVLDKINKDFRIGDMKPKDFVDLIAKYGLRTRARNGEHNTDIIDADGQIVSMYSIDHSGSGDVKRYNLHNLLWEIRRQITAGTFRPTRWLSK